jgi:UDP-N-acetylglucosamine--N-acetylmuramyl-(pentapeptide) pyrophosphoryl-undecaprenol N-acetylglucosamine transferase
MKILLSGGGTGGHVYPAIAIANEMQKRYPDAEILFVGTANGIESEIVPKNGYKIKTITVQGFKRKIDLDNVKRCMKLCKGLNEASKIVKEFKPDVVIGTGGYVSGPILLKSSIGKNKAITIVHEQNSFPGITNKILSQKVNTIITCFDDAKERFPKNAQGKVKLIGNPVREELLEISKEDARVKLNIPKDKKMVLIYGGSGGFKKINDAMIDAIRDFVNQDTTFIFATGNRYYDDVKNKLKDINFKDYQRIIPYLDDMASALSSCDLVVGSAGATSLSEITALGKPSIIIPKSYTAENHQEYNAKNIENNKAGICILESELSENPNILNIKIKEILYNDELLNELSKGSKKIGNPTATKDICDYIEKLLNSRVIK